MRSQDASVTDSLPRSVPTVDAAVRMQAVFPGAASPARVVIWNVYGDAVDSTAAQTALDDLKRRIAVPVTVVEVDHVVVVRVPLPGSGTDTASNPGVAKELRDDVLPATLGTLDGIGIGIGYAVAGRTAVAHDLTSVVAARTPLVFVFVPYS
ncbi:hypothetical protein [Micromonospora sp. KC723]|uniref:hypothetical protein n=1 Tax=Micromonospora sp. KC723 TaxID=2530381 RepID=UPI001A9E1C58|nr:hypothetical protein [Micromonospora sp. KC723]